MRPSKNLETKTLLDMLKSSPSMHESSGSRFFRTTTGIRSGPDAFGESGSFLTILGVTEWLWSLRLHLEGHAGKEITEPLTLEFFETFLANNFALPEAEDNSTGSLNRGSIADLPSLRTLLAIRQKSREPRFWEVMDSFVLLVYTCLAASRTLLPWLLACLKFTLDSKDLFCWYKRKKWFLYEQWQQQKKVKTMEMSETWPDIYNVGYNPLTKVTSSSRITEFKDIPNEHLSNDHEGRSKWHENRHMLCDETSHFEFDGKSMKTETTPWWEFPNRGKAVVEQIIAPEERSKSKRAGQINHLSTVTRDRPVYNSSFDGSLIGWSGQNKIKYWTPIHTISYSKFVYNSINSLRINFSYFYFLIFFSISFREMGWFHESYSRVACRERGEIT